MLYRQVLLYYLVPPILVLLGLYHPLLGRRDGIKILWLCLAATVWTTPWDNWIISQSGWTYPPDSVLFRIWFIPIEEHVFFILQPIFLVLLHSICTHHRILPFDVGDLQSSSLPTLMSRRYSRENLGSSQSPVKGSLGQSPVKGSVGSPGTPVRQRSTQMVLDETPSPSPSPSSRLLKRRVSKESSLNGFGSPGGGSGIGSPRSYTRRQDAPRKVVQTFRRRPKAAMVWIGAFLLGCILLGEAHGIFSLSQVIGVEQALGERAFYLGWILVWVSPIIGGLTWLGGRPTTADWVTWIVGTAYLSFVDSVGIRSGAWTVSRIATFGLDIAPGLPLEEFIFFTLTSYLVILTCSIISHLHTLLLLSPSLPPCPPLNPVSHVRLLFRVSWAPPPTDVNVLHGLQEAEATLRKGSKSFSVAKLAFGREMRIGLVAMYSWCRVTDNLIDEPTSSTSNDQSEDALHQVKLHTLESIRKHLQTTYTNPYPASTSLCDGILDTVANIDPSTRSAFRLFSAIIPRLVPIQPFLELCNGYEVDTRFAISKTSESPAPAPAPVTSTSTSSPTNHDRSNSGSMPAPTSRRPLPGSPFKSRIMRDGGIDMDRHLPIKTSQDLMNYADDVAGSIAAAICCLAWSILDVPTDPSDSLTPVKDHRYWTSSSSTPPFRPLFPAQSIRDISETQTPQQDGCHRRLIKRSWVVARSREMGRALQLVNISRDIAKDALLGRLYIPLSAFPSASALLDILLPSSSLSSYSSSTSPASYSPYTTTLLEKAYEMRASSEMAIRELPRTARGGTRAMVGSYFEIGEAIRQNGGEVDERGVRVSKFKRGLAAARAMWLGT